MKPFVLFLFFAVLTFLSCSKSYDGPQLPPVTQTGENTFGCYVNGRLLLPRDGKGTVMGPDEGMYFSASGEAPNYNYNEINVQDFVSPNGGSMDIHITKLHEGGEGMFEIKESNCDRFSYANNSINIRCRYYNGVSYDYYCSIEGSGYLNITRYDFDNRIVSGTFSFSAKNENNPNDIIEITEGRFDLKWDTLPYKDFP